MQVPVVTATVRQHRRTLAGGNAVGNYSVGDDVRSLTSKAKLDQRLVTSSPTPRLVGRGFLTAPHCGVQPATGALGTDAPYPSRESECTQRDPNPTYDAKGNLTNRPGWLYTWNANNQLLIAEPGSPTNGAVKMTFAYDGKHRCVRRQSWSWSTNTASYSLSASTYLQYSGWNLIEERDGGTNLTAYAYGSQVDEILAKFTSTNTVFYHGDAQNSTLALTDGSATVLERYRYEAFGLPSIYNASFSPLSASLYSVRHLFQGREWLAEVKLNDHRFRYYSPELQRWMSRDPIEELGGLNIYGAFGENPALFTDPHGLLIPIPIIIGVIGIALVIDAVLVATGIWENPFNGIMDKGVVGPARQGQRDALQQCKKRHQGDSDEIDQLLKNWENELYPGLGQDVKNVIDTVPGTSTDGPVLRPRPR